MANLSVAANFRRTSGVTLASTLAHMHGVLLGELLDSYQRRQEPIAVEFRKLVSPVGGGPRAPHFIHPYPAKLLVHIPFFFICNDLLLAEGGKVIDPFCGSGTVLLESLLAGRSAIGSDSNPLARLVSCVKTTPLQVASLRKAASRLLSKIESSKPLPPSDVAYLKYWFHPHAMEQLARIRGAIETVRKPEHKSFFKVCLSVCVRKVSLADPRVSVPVRLRAGQYPPGHPLRERTNRLIRELRVVNAFKVFAEAVKANMSRMAGIEYLLKTDSRVTVTDTDAREIRSVPYESVDLVVTSPPYMGAQKYIRSSSLSLGWLGLASAMELKELDRQCLGREHFTKAEYAQEVITGISDADEAIHRIYARNPLRGCLVATYLREMRQILSSVVEKIKPGGNIALVCSNNTVCGEAFQTQRYLAQILRDLSLVERLRLVDTIRSRGLMTKRNRTASMITREWILLYQKPQVNGTQRHEQR